MSEMYAKVIEILQAETSDLRELAKIAGADPSVFYRGANFRKADLVNEDLRGIGLDMAIVDNCVMPETDMDPILVRPVSDFDLNYKTKVALRREGIVYIGDLITKTEVDLLKLQHIGKKALTEIKNVLAQQALSLGMRLDEWPPSFLRYGYKSVWEKDDLADLLKKSIRYLDLSEKCYATLSKYGFETIRELVLFSEDHLLTHIVDDEMLSEIKDALDQQSLSLGMSLNEANEELSMVEL